VIDIDVRHLERWLERIEQRVDSISEIVHAAGLIADADISRKVVAWGYTSAITSGGNAWIVPAKYEPIDFSCARCFNDIGTGAEELSHHLKLGGTVE
jgi:hypothetical protein